MNSRRIGRWAATLVLALMAAPSMARAQGSRYDNIVLSPQGKPLAAATVAVCTAAASTATTPCSPLATVYTDATLTTPAANPLTADGLGNYGFWAPPGKYLVQIYGSGITTKVNTVILPCDPSSNCTMGTSSAISAFSLNLSGNLSVAGALTASGSGNTALKPAVTDAIQFVSANGSDSNDGLSWGTAKLTVMAGYDALPATGGTIFITGCAYGTGCTVISATSTAGQGIWILGSGDPNFASPPTGWRKFKPTRFIGTGGVATSQNATSGVATAILAGSQSNPNVPAIWLSGVAGIEFRNLEFQYPSIVIRVGVDSNGNRSSGAAANSNIVFHNIIGNIFNSPGTASFGPTVDIGSNVLWLLINECTFQGNAAAAANTDNRAAILINTGGGPASGLIYIQKTHFTGGGGIRFYAAMNGTGSVYVRDGLQEGSGQSQPMLDIIGTGVFTAQAENVGNSDSGDAPPIVRVAAGNPPSYTTVITSAAASGVSVEGPATVLNTNQLGTPSLASLFGGALANVSPAAKFQLGDFAGRALNQVDAHRRSFAPSLVRFANNLQGNTQLPSSWTAGSGTITTGVTAPDGTTNAATVTGEGRIFGVSLTFNVGDYVYIGVWARQASTAAPYVSGSSAAALSLQFPFGSNPTWQLLNGSGGQAPAGIASNSLTTNPYNQTDGGWQWLWAVGKVIASCSACGTRFDVNGSASQPMSYYAPIFVQIPASSVALVSAPTFSSASESTNTVTITTTAAHNLSVGEPIVISACSITGYNGGFAIAAVPTSTTFTYFDSNTGLGSPTGCVITPGNDSEVAEWALNASSYADNAPSNSVAGLRGEPLAFGANGSNFFGTLSHSNTANRTYTFPDATGNVVLDSAAQTLSAKTFSSPTLSGHLNQSSANGDIAGQISISAATSGSKTFGTAYTSAPVCAASPTSNPGSTTWWVTASTTAVTVNLSASSTITFNYTCKGNPN
jgi:hypothetical protein